MPAEAVERVSHSSVLLAYCVSHLHGGLEAGALLRELLLVQEGVLLAEAVRVVPAAQVLEPWVLRHPVGNCAGLQ